MRRFINVKVEINRKPLSENMLKNLQARFDSQEFRDYLINYKNNEHQATPVVCLEWRASYCVDDRGISIDVLRDEIEYYMYAMLESTGTEINEATDEEIIEFLNEVSLNLKVLSIKNYGAYYALGLDFADEKIKAPTNIALVSQHKENEEMTK